MHTLIIAEAGVNHNGNIDVAYEMVDAAVEAGADVVKFQTGKPEAVVSRFADKADYQKKTTGEGESQLEMLKKLAFSYEQFSLIKEYCKKKEIQFLSTPFDCDSVDFLRKLECAMWKIPSGEITNFPYLIKIAQTHLPIILSTGMSNIYEIRRAVEVLIDYGAGEITLLHCNTQYPTPYQDVNLRAMNTLAKEFGLEVGYSDHTLGIEVPIAAVAMGATVIEKHFTLSRKMKGPDHQSSLEPNELKAMIMAIRNIELALGDGRKKVSNSEMPNKLIARKSIIAAKNIRKGEIFTPENITTKRPGNGISPMEWNKIIGTSAIRDFKEDELIEI